MPAVDAGHIREFVGRPWGAAERAKREHWASEFRDRGPDATLAASLALWHHMRTVRPDWPTAEDRRQDLRHHIVLKHAIDRAARVVAGLSVR